SDEKLTLSPPRELFLVVANGPSQLLFLQASDDTSVVHFREQVAAPLVRDLGALSRVWAIGARVLVIVAPGRSEEEVRTLRENCVLAHGALLENVRSSAVRGADLLDGLGRVFGNSRGVAENLLAHEAGRRVMPIAVSAEATEAFALLMRVRDTRD